MKANSYKLVSDREPTYAELNNILNAATFSVIENATAANENAKKNQQLYHKKIKAAYGKKIKAYASKA